MAAVVITYFKPYNINPIWAITGLVIPLGDITWNFLYFGCKNFVASKMKNQKIGREECRLAQSFSKKYCESARYTVHKELSEFQFTRITIAIVLLTKE